mmetsp:Transcript_56761/g.130556  ORF Transcript_56761/g.130556 Transcript_56761/m.130556 type:complete len:137 (+) Transcript_56761:125-535(+)
MDVGQRHGVHLEVQRIVPTILPPMVQDRYYSSPSTLGELAVVVAYLLLSNTVQDDEFAEDEITWGQLGSPGQSITASTVLKWCLHRLGFVDRREVKDLIIDVVLAFGQVLDRLFRKRPDGPSQHGLIDYEMRICQT